MKLLYILFCMAFFSCSKTDNFIIIKGIVKNIPAKKVYLTDAYKWQVFLDSSEYKNDTFSFNIKQNNFEPFLASICFADSNSDGKIKDLLYQNYILSTRDRKYGHAAFVLDRGITTISGTVFKNTDIKTDKLKIIGSKQNDPFFSMQLSDFGWINTNDKLQREKIITGYKRLIKQYPYSYYFISMLYNYRTQYTKEELLDMLALFNNEAQSFSYSQKFSFYFKEMPSPGKPLHNYALKDSLNQSKSIITDSSNLNIIIFWASWCAPCRKEIPQLKKIYNEFKNRSIHMVSISVDEDKAKWKFALLKEDMRWEQLIIDSSLSDKVKSSFNFASIPLIIFADNKGFEISRFWGYEDGNKEEYTSIIEKYLKKFHD